MIGAMPLRGVNMVQYKLQRGVCSFENVFQHKGTLILD